MKLAELSIKNYQFTIVVFLLLTLFGLMSYFTMPQTENPSIVIPGASIVAVYPGAGPEDLEQLVAQPIEESLNELDEIKKISTTLNEGLAYIGIEFTYKTNAQDKYDEVIQKINSVKSDLPEDLMMLKISRWTSSDVAILQLALTSDSAEYSSLNNKAENLKKILERVDGIKRVELHANPESQINIELDFEKMSQMNISIDDVANAIKSANANIPGGSFQIGDKSFAVKTSGSFNNIKEIGNTIVKSYKGKIIDLKSIANIDYGYEKIKYKARFMGKKSVFVTLQQKEQYNIFEIKEDIFPQLADFESSLPENIDLEIVFDQAKKVDEHINGFKNSLLIGILLVGIVILFALGFRSSIVVIIAIPLSIIISLGVVDITGFGIQQITIAALIVALGLLVDNSIVIVENIKRFIDEGYKANEAAVKASSQIGYAIASSTLTTVLAFVPIILMPDKAGDYIKSLPITIIATLTISLLIALTLSPLITSLLYSKKTRLEKKVLAENNKFKLKHLLKFIIEGPYRNTLKFSLKKPWVVIIIATSILVISLGAFKYMGLSFFPPAETNEFMIRVHLPEGSSLDETEKAVNYAEGILDSKPNVKKHASNIGHGNPRIYYTIFPSNYKKNFADIYVQLNKFKPKTFYQSLDSLKRELNTYAGAKFNIKSYLQGPPSQAPIMVYFTGKDVNLLNKYANEIVDVLESTDGVINVENQLDKSRIDVNVNIDKEKANMLGIPVHIIDKTVRTAIAGAEVSSFRDKYGDEYKIVLKMKVDKKFKMDDFKKIYVKSLSGKMIPLMEVAALEFNSSSAKITRLNLQRSALVTADFEPAYTIDEVLAPTFTQLEKMQLPPAYKYYIEGQFAGRQESFAGMQNAVLIAIISILAVLILQFRSFKQPLIIFTAIPLAIIGSIWALFLAGLTFSFTAFIGLSGLIGIVINNSIILVDYTNQLRRDENMSIIKALQKAGETRFTPIILTTLTTIGGLLPLTLSGGLLWAPMGWTIIGGLLVSTFLTLLVVPVLYLVLEK